MRLLDDLRRAKRLSVLARGQTRQGVAAVATNHIRDLSAIRSSPGKALIVMSMAGEKCVGAIYRPFRKFRRSARACRHSSHGSSPQYKADGA